MADPLYFLHIPKTAGTSLTRYLDSQFPRQAIFPFQLWSDYVDSPYFDDSEVSKEYYRLYRGHFGHGFLGDANKALRTVTFLRDPRSHMLSLFNHMLTDRVNGTEVHPGFETLPDSFCSYLRQTQNQERLADIQSRYLSSGLRCQNVGVADLAGGSFLTAIISSQVDALAHARADALDFVGIQEYFAESVILLGSLLSFHAPDPQELYATYMKLDRARGADRLSSEEGAIVDAITSNDRRLYEERKAQMVLRYDEVVSGVLGKRGWSLSGTDRAERRTVAELLIRSGELMTKPLDTPEVPSAKPRRFVRLPSSDSVEVERDGEAKVTLSFRSETDTTYFGYTKYAPIDSAPLLVATDSPTNRSSEFFHPSWFSESRPASEFSVEKGKAGRPDAICRGDDATASFLIKAPAKPGMYTERFTVVQEGVEAFSDELGFELTIRVS